MSNQIQNRATVEWHIGLMEENGTWTWASGTKLKTADCEEKQKGCWPWQPPNEPTDSPNEKVAVMYKDYLGKKGFFNNIAAEYQKRGFICEITKGEC